ncbi:MAG: hypothetical protein J7M24_07065, partial [Candidatus Latescibacteria bacterium]|nr:hypothetical protein [Candidatus Latescibacterota bacterium]
TRRWSGIPIMAGGTPWGSGRCSDIPATGLITKTKETSPFDSLSLERRWSDASLPRFSPAPARIVGEGDGGGEG